MRNSTPAGSEPRHGPDHTARGDEPALLIENLTVALRGSGLPVVDDVSLSVRPGETLCVVGESGSGKSVTSLAVMGLLDRQSLHPSKGRILVGGKDVLATGPADLRRMRAREMAMVFQEPMTALNPVETVGDQIAEVFAVHARLPRREVRARVVEMLRSVHMPDPEKTYDVYPHQLSGGQRQRIVISMALILKPRLLIADEPTTALDVTTQKQILSLIRELQTKFNTAVLFITHDFGVVAEIADRIAVMNRGRLVEVGTRDEILRAPREDYTKMLITSVPSLTPRVHDRTLGAPTLQVRGLTKTYSDFRLFGGKRQIDALKDASLALRRGQIVGVVGESGSGKSTLARCIVRLVDPTAGEVRLGDVDIARLPARKLRPYRKRIQIVFQDPYRSLNARRRVGESLMEGLLNFGVDRRTARARTHELMELVGLDPASADRYPHQFSGGQRQRLCIARALALDPDVLIADEAVSALDVSVQRQVLDLIENIRDRKNVAVLFITHDLRVAAQICDHIIVMQNGRIVEADDAASVLANPREAYTRALLAAAPGRNWDFENLRPISSDTVSAVSGAGVAEPTDGGALSAPETGDRE